MVTPYFILAQVTIIYSIIDFGIAQIDGNTKFKKYGTYNYCSLEKLSGKDIDFHEDMYAIGIILYELLGGTLSKEDKGNVLLINYDNKEDLSWLQVLKNLLKERNLEYNDEILKKVTKEITKAGYDIITKPFKLERYKQTLGQT